VDAERERFFVEVPKKLPIIIQSFPRLQLLAIQGNVLVIAMGSIKKAGMGVTRDQGERDVFGDNSPDHTPSP
jgi:hypothetical protein